MCCALIKDLVARKVRMSNKAAVLGAGISGLSAGWQLAEKFFHVDVYEKEDFLGGTSSTFKHGEYLLDYGPHKIYTQMEDVYSEIKKLIGSDLLEIPKRSRIRLEGKYYDYPVRMPQLLLGLNPVTTASLGSSYLYAILQKNKTAPGDASYESYLKDRFGTKLYSMISKPYARKVWGEPDTLSASLAQSSASVPSLSELAKRTVFGDRGKKELSASVFHYPKKGIIEVSNKMAEKIHAHRGKIHLKKEIHKVVLENGHIASAEFSDGTSCEADYYVSTMPVKELLHIMEPAPIRDVANAVDRLKHKNLVLVYLAVNKPRLFEDNWILFPEKEYAFNRIFEQKNFSPYMIPKDKTVLTCELTCSPGDKIWKMNDEKLKEIVVSQLSGAGILSEKDVTECFTKRIMDAYPVYDIGYEEHRQTVMAYLGGLKNLYSIGRSGYFNYVGIADCMDMGFRTAGHIARKGTHMEWEELRKGFENYQTID